MLRFSGAAGGRLADERGEIRGLFLKIGLAAVLVALVIVQVGPILSNKMEIGGVASDAAGVGINRYRQTRGDMKEVKLSVERSLEEQGARLVGEVAAYPDENGDMILSFAARKISRTWLFYHVGFLAPYTEAMASVKERIYD
jgi:hypothetical protein